LQKYLDLDELVEVFSKEKGYAKVRRGETCFWKWIRVEEVRLDNSAPEHEAVVLLRDLRRPECLFGWRAPAVEPDVFENDLYVHCSVKDAAETHAMVVSVNLEEDLTLMYALRSKTCTPGQITWF
jgi:hypothetical protein